MASGDSHGHTDAQGRRTWAHDAHGHTMHTDAQRHTTHTDAWGTCMHTDARMHTHAHRCTHAHGHTHAHSCTRAHACTQLHGALRCTQLQSSTQRHTGSAALVQSSQLPAGTVLGEAVPWLCPRQLLGHHLQCTPSPTDRGHGRAQSWGPISLLHPGAPQPHNHLDLLSSHQAASSDLAGETQGDPVRAGTCPPAALPRHPSTVLPWLDGLCQAPAPIHHQSRPGSAGLSGRTDAGAASPASHFSG